MARFHPWSRVESCPWVYHTMSTDMEGASMVTIFDHVLRIVHTVLTQCAQGYNGRMICIYQKKSTIQLKLAQATFRLCANL